MRGGFSYQTTRLPAHCTGFLCLLCCKNLHEQLSFVSQQTGQQFIDSSCSAVVIEDRFSNDEIVFVLGNVQSYDCVSTCRVCVSLRAPIETYICATVCF